MRFRTAPPQQVEVVFTADQYSRLHTHLFQENEDEQAALAFVSPAASNGRIRLLVHHLVFLMPEHYDEQTGVYLKFTHETEKAIAEHAIEEQWGLIEIHSHPFANDFVNFSSIDLEHALPRFRWFAGQTQEIQKQFHHGMLVFGKNSADGLFYLPDHDRMYPIDRVTILSHPLRHFYIARPEPSLKEGVYVERTTRQVQAFGAYGQAKLADLAVGIVGLGGIGSILAYLLALLGVRKFVLVDDDRIEASNLNRFIGASAQDAANQTPKVRVIERLIKQVDPQAEVVAFQQKFPTSDNVEHLKMVDVLLGCTDSHGSRLLLNAFSVQYLLPYIDIGVGINSDEAGQIQDAGGQFRVLLPERFCLQCIRAIDPDQAGRDLLSQEQKEAHRVRGYIPAEDIPAPAVSFLNTTLASLAAGEFFNLVTGFQAPSEILYYFLKDQAIRKITASRDPDCVACGPTGRFAAGDFELALGLPISALPADELPVPTGHAPSADLSAASAPPPPAAPAAPPPTPPAPAG
ncbi:MAG: HesA/MoeB/ThiF family protein [Candidatus Flexifilum sp.]